MREAPALLCILTHPFAPSLCFVAHAFRIHPKPRSVTRAHLQNLRRAVPLHAEWPLDSSLATLQRVGIGGAAPCDTAATPPHALAYTFGAQSYGPYASEGILSEPDARKALGLDCSQVRNTWMLCPRGGPPLLLQQMPSEVPLTGEERHALTKLTEGRLRERAVMERAACAMRRAREASVAAAARGNDDLSELDAAPKRAAAAKNTRKRKLE